LKFIIGESFNGITPLFFASEFLQKKDFLVLVWVFIDSLCNTKLQQNSLITKKKKIFA
jgi:hypothetical protein